MKQDLLSLGLALALAGCARSSLSPIPTTIQLATARPASPEPAITQSRPTRTPFPTWLPPSPTPTSAWPTLVPAQAPLGQIKLTRQRIGQITLDDAYVYWTPDQDESHIFRAPLLGGETKIVATTTYDDGRLNSYHHIRSQDWLIFVDTPTSAEGVTWKVRALNLRDGREQVVIEQVGDPDSWPGPSLDADGDWIVWTRSEHVQTPDCITQTTLAMRNLKTGQQRVIEQVCAQDHYMLMFPHLSNDYLVYERDLPDHKGRGNDIYLYDLQASQLMTLTSNHQSSMPGISYPWVVWKDAPRFNYGQVTMVYDVRGGQTRQVQIPTEEHSDPHVNGHWLYWVPDIGAPVYVYDLENHRFHSLIAPGSNENIYTVAIYGDWIAWERDLDFNSGRPHDWLIEWRKLPGASSGRP